MESDLNNQRLLSPLMTVIVIKNYFQSENIPNTLQLMEDDIIYVLNKPNDYWWDGVMIDPVGNISRGWFPASYTKPYKHSNNNNNNNNNRSKLNSSISTSSLVLNSTKQLSPTNSQLSNSNEDISTNNNDNQSNLSNSNFQLNSSSNRRQSIKSKQSLFNQSFMNKSNINFNQKINSLTNHNQTYKHNHNHSHNHHNHKYNSNHNHHNHCHCHNINHNHNSFTKHKNINSNNSTLSVRSHSLHHHINSKSTINHSDLSQQHQSISTLKEDQNSLSSSSTPLFKEKNYFISKHDSFSSNQLNQQSDSRQSSQAQTDLTLNSIPNSFHLVTNEEVKTYFQPSLNLDSQPSFNFIPVWLPQITTDNDIVYKNQALNVLTKELPLIDANYINDESLFESPDTLNLISDLNPLPLSIRRQNTLESSLNLTPSLNNFNNIKRFSTINNNKNFKNTTQSHIINNLPNFTNSRLTEIFYTDQTDILTWDTLSTSFINSLDQCISSLKRLDKPNFKTSLNDSSNCLSLLHIAGRLIHQQLIDSNKLIQFSSIIKKITNVFIHFRILTTLIIESIDRSETSKNINILETKNNNLKDNLTEGKLNSYKDYSYRCRSKIEKLLNHLCLLVSSLSIAGPNGVYQKNESKILPMIYSRFIRDKYEGGNFQNKFAGLKYLQSDFFVNSIDSKKQTNILLDDDAINKLKTTEQKIINSLKDVEKILSLKMPQDSTLQKFLDDRNLKLLTSIYQSIPLLDLFINTIESIDLTVFAMIDRLAAKHFQPERQNTIVTSLSDNQNINNTSMDETNNSSNNRNNNNSSNSITNINNTNINNTNINNIAANNQDLLNYNNSRSDSNVSYNYNKGDVGQSPRSENDTNTYLSDDTDNSNQSFYDATAKTFRPMINEFIYLKQMLHSAFNDLILDSQTITATDPETFFPIERDIKNFSKGASKTKQLREIVLKQLALLDSELSHGGIYTLEPSLKLLETIKLSSERMNLIIVSVTQLKDERRSILNYCSRLMNTDFNIASLFIAERHNTLISITSQPSIGKSTSTMNSMTETVDPTFYNDERDNNIDNLIDNQNNLYNLEVPWYMGSDNDEENLIYESSTLKGGPVRGLISKLINPLNLSDDMFEFTFYCLFSTFVKPTTLFEILFEKYHISMPDALSYEEYGIWLEKKLKPQQKNVLNVFENLFSKYWIVKYTSSELIDMWNDFVVETPSIPTSLISLANKVFSFDDQEEYIDYFKLGNCESKTIPMSILTPSITHLKLLSLNINYVAEQITAVQAFYYRKINLWDLLGRTYNFNKLLHKKSERNNDPLNIKNISNFIKNCNRLTHFTTYMILRRKNLSERIESIKFFISLAEKLLSLKNFSSMTAIISGLGSTSISRLRNTWKEIPSSYNLKFQKMDNLMSIGKNYSEYRNILRFVETDDDPYLPFLGMYLSDLRFTTDGNPDWLGSKRGRKGLVNFSKRVSIMKIVKEVMDYNKNLYQIKLDPDFSCYLNQMFSGLPDDEKMYELSIQIEPRVSLLKNSNNLSTNTTASNSKTNSGDTAGLNMFFGGYSSTFGSVSTAISSQSGELNNNNNNNNNNTSVNTKQDAGKKSKRRPN